MEIEMELQQKKKTIKKIKILPQNKKEEKIGRKGKRYI